MNEVPDVGRYGEFPLRLLTLIFRSWERLSLLLLLLFVRVLGALLGATLDVSVLQEVPHFDGQRERIDWHGSNALGEGFELLHLLRIYKNDN